MFWPKIALNLILTACFKVTSPTILSSRLGFLNLGFSSRLSGHNIPSQKSVNNLHGSVLLFALPRTKLESLTVHRSSAISTSRIPSKMLCTHFLEHLVAPILSFVAISILFARIRKSTLNLPMANAGTKCLKTQLSSKAIQ